MRFLEAFGVDTGLRAKLDISILLSDQLTICPPSGVPSIVTPCFADQPELAAKTKALGVGIALKQFRTITPKKLQARTGAPLSAVQCPR